MGVIVQLLFGVMLEKGRFRGAYRRAAVLGMLGGCIDEELGNVRGAVVEADGVE